MTTPYLADILAQPEALRATLAALPAQRPALQALARIGAGLPAGAPVVLTGMGASLAALVPLQLDLVAAGHVPVVIETGELIHHAPALLDRAALLVAVSQSGRSGETVHLLEHAPPRLPIVGVTNDADSPLATRANHAIVTAAGSESTVSCKTYLATLAGLRALGAALRAAPLPPVLAEGHACVEAVASYLASLDGHVRALQVELAGVRQLYHAGRGRSLATAQCAGLITKEAAHVPAEGMSGAAFRHGPLEMIGPDTLVVVYEGSPETAALDHALVRDVQRLGGRVVLCGSSAPDGPWRLPAAPWPELVEILPAQLTTLALAALAGREAGRFTHARKVTTSL